MLTLLTEGHIFQGVHPRDAGKWNIDELSYHTLDIIDEFLRYPASVLYQSLICRDLTNDKMEETQHTG